tara:strand:- start:478 stop:1020 length:543 start_codon:yes stop_codon:yes gene_type:complete
MRGIDKLFRFDQLSRGSQIEALYNERDAMIKAGYRYADESINSLFEFAEILGSKITTFDINFYDVNEKSYCKFLNVWKYKDIDLYEIIEELSMEDGMFTGYFADVHLFRCLRELVYEDGITDPNLILKKCFQSWLNACREEANAYLSEDYLRSKFEAGDFLFLEDGTFFSTGDNPLEYLV